MLFVPEASPDILDEELEPPMPASWTAALDRVLEEYRRTLQPSSRPSHGVSIWRQEMVMQLLALWREVWLEEQRPRSPDVLFE
eukprot:2601997-Rhodomonas_salina.2